MIPHLDAYQLIGEDSREWKKLEVMKIWSYWLPTWRFTLKFCQTYKWRAITISSYESCKI
jgi:hypothetical protein